MWGEGKIEIDKERLPEMEREIVATIMEIEERYERLREFERLSVEDEEVRRTLVGIRDKLGDLKTRLLSLPYLIFEMTPPEMVKEVGELVKNGADGVKQINTECNNGKTWINFTLALRPNLTSPSTIRGLNQISGLDNHIPKLHFLRMIYE